MKWQYFWVMSDFVEYVCWEEWNTQPTATVTLMWKALIYSAVTLIRNFSRWDAFWEFTGRSGVYFIRKCTACCVLSDWIYFSEVTERWDKWAFRKPVEIVSACVFCLLATAYERKNSFVLIQHKVPPPSLTDRLDDTPPPHFICSDAVNVSLHFQMKYHYFSCRISVKYLSAHFHLCMRLKCVCACAFESRMQRDLFDLFLMMKISTRRFNCQHLRLWAFIDHSQKCLWSSVIKMQLSGMLYLLIQCIC